MGGFCACEAVSNEVAREGFAEKVTSEETRGGGAGRVAVGTAGAKALLGMLTAAHLWREAAAEEAAGRRGSAGAEGHVTQGIIPALTFSPSLSS